MQFEWDEAKNAANMIKHGIDFADAVAVFEGWTYSRPDLRFDYGEQRQITIGRVDDLIVVTIVHTDRNGSIRIISARSASRKERLVYESALQQAIDDGRASPNPR